MQVNGTMNYFSPLINPTAGRSGGAGVTRILLHKWRVADVLAVSSSTAPLIDQIASQVLLSRTMICNFSLSKGLAAAKG